MPPGEASGRESWYGPPHVDTDHTRVGKAAIKAKAAHTLGRWFAGRCAGEVESAARSPTAGACRPEIMNPWPPDRIWTADPPPPEPKPAEEKNGLWCTP
jgi:hypothetical protein